MSLGSQLYLREYKSIFKCKFQRILLQFRFTVIIKHTHSIVVNVNVLIMMILHFFLVFALHSVDTYCSLYQSYPLNRVATIDLDFYRYFGFWPVQKMFSNELTCILINHECEYSRRKFNFLLYLCFQQKHLVGMQI